MNETATHTARVDRNAAIDTVARLMLFMDASQMEVVDASTGERVGRITVKDLLHQVADGSDSKKVKAGDLAHTAPGEELLGPESAEVGIQLSAGDVMTSPAVVCREETDIEQVAELLADREISGMPVVDRSGSIVGVISERDLARALGGSLIRIAMGKHVRSGPFLRDVAHVAQARCAADVMSRDPVVAEVDTPLHELAGILFRRGVNRVPVVRDGALVGVVTRGDVLAAVAGGVDASSPAVAPRDRGVGRVVTGTVGSWA